MGNGADWSAPLARIQVWRAVLTYLEPDGKWSKSPLLQHWGQIRYGLSLAQLTALEAHLATEYDHAQERYRQQRLAGHRKDPTRIQLQIPGISDGS